MCTKVYALVLMLFAAVSVYGQDNVIDEVVWVVGDEAILKSDVENERLNAQYEGRKFDGDPYCIIPEQLAIQKLFLHQAAIDSIEVSEQEIISDVERRTNWLIGFVVYQQTPIFPMTVGIAHQIIQNVHHIVAGSIQL